MPRLSFTTHLRRHVACPAEDIPGATLRQLLDAYFARHPQVRGYVLDEQQALRRHVVIFIGDEQARDRTTLSDAVSADAEVYVMQALSGDGKPWPWRVEQIWSLETGEGGRLWCGTIGGPLPLPDRSGWRHGGRRRCPARLPPARDLGRIAAGPG